MKRISVLVVFMMMLVVGCSMSNNPKSKVEELFIKYQKLDNDILINIDDLIKDDSLTKEQTKRYKDLIKKQYSNLIYTIKDEEIDGNNALVTVEIDVLDYRKTINELNMENVVVDTLKYNDHKLDKLENTKDKVTYTLKINLIKDNNGKWSIKELTKEDIKKIQGMY